MSTIALPTLGVPSLQSILSWRIFHSAQRYLLMRKPLILRLMKKNGPSPFKKRPKQRELLGPGCNTLLFCNLNSKYNDYMLIYIAFLLLRKDIFNNFLKFIIKLLHCGNLAVIKVSHYKIGYGCQ